MRLRTLAKDLCPPLFFRWLIGRPAATFSGDYPDFNSASKASEGYTSANIIAAEIAAFRNTDFQNSSLDERTMQLLAAFATLPGPLRVLDYGGASGYYYYRLSRFIRYALDWIVLETKPMVDSFGNLDPPGLRHTTEFESDYDVVLFSGSLQYLSAPYDVLSALSPKTKYLVFNRLPLTGSNRDRLMVQKSVMHYTSSYPVWFFSREKFLAFVSRLGSITMQWTMSSDFAILEGRRVYYSGLVVQLK